MSLKVRDQYKCLQKGPTKGYEQFIRQMRAKRVSGVKQPIMADGIWGFLLNLAVMVVQAAGVATESNVTCV